MEKAKKYGIIGIIFLILIMPMFFGVYIDYVFIREVNLFVLLILIIGFFLLLFVGKLIEIYGYNSKIMALMENHDIINALINKNEKVVLWVFFPTIIIIEELLFRYYIVGFLTVQLNFEMILVALISSVLFSLYHIQMFRYLNSLRSLIINLSYSFLLGLYNSFVVLTVGIIPCIIIHYCLVFYLYYSTYKRYFKK
jgi:membrane protease YdiL (CAAX protease family)